MNAQLKKAVPLLLVAALAVLLFVARRCKNEQTARPKTDVSNTNAKRSTNTTDRNKGFDRRVSYIEYSNHAKCRMQCRKISQAEVEEIMRDGKINYNKSDLQNARCPQYALEGVTADDQEVRIVFAQCNEKSVVVTVIDLDTEWSCSCPGDDKKFKNRN